MRQSNFLKSRLRGECIPQCINSHFINEEHSSKHMFLPHAHKNYLELFFVSQGEGQYMVDGQYYNIRKGDIVIINAGLLHSKSCAFAKNLRSYSVGICDLALSGLPDNCLCAKGEPPVVSCGLISDQIGEMFRLIYLLHSDKKHLSDICDCMALSLILLIYEMLNSRSQNESKKPRSSASATADRIRNYLDEHYRESLTLSAIARELNVNEYYLSHIFKDEFGIPPMQYVMRRRIGEAQSLLMDTSIPIGDIADMLGFSSISHLNTMFSKYVGLPPGKYRQSLRNMEE